MAFGIGLVSTQFSSMNVLLRGLPFENADRLVYLERLNTRIRLSIPLPMAEFTRFRDRQQSFEDLGAFETEHKTVSRQDRLPQRYRAAAVTANLHSLLRVEPALGRGFQPADAESGAVRVILLSHSLWQRDFDGSPAALGSAVRLDGDNAVIIGVMPPEFYFPKDQALWVSLREGVAGTEVEVFGKLKRDITTTEAQAEFDVLTTQLESPETTRDNAGVAARYLTRIVAGDEGGSDCRTSVRVTDNLC